MNILNLKSGELHLTEEILANIFLGQVTYWDDPTIQNINPHLKMPHLEIVGHISLWPLS
ncbi:hypothetical protein JGUZn3_11620 [Entomobacter blattae]|uniref:Uncharacterized protein n=1 Tax=Entomobacter blattae TaxID=2762277 RepID=A0A7H1NRH8_9PROT|nr:hypothetical protein JGUZn3_11620 [Entomobacter blattae]